jgi:transposase-like protein
VPIWSVENPSANAIVAVCISVAAKAIIRGMFEIRGDQQRRSQAVTCDALMKGSVMRRHKAEEIVAKLRHVEGLAATGRRVSECVRSIGVTEVTYYRWRNRYGGLESELAEYLAELEADITRLRRLVSDLTLDKLILLEATTEALSPELRAIYVLHAKSAFGISERRACQALGQHRSTQRKIRARLSLKAPPVTGCHSADVSHLSNNPSDRRTKSTDGTRGAAQDSAQGERVSMPIQASAPPQVR